MAVLPPILFSHVIAWRCVALRNGKRGRVSGYKHALTAHSRRSLIQCVISMDKGTTGRLAPGPLSISTLGHATGCLFGGLRAYYRTALLGRRPLSVIGVFDRRRGMRIARALDSLPHLRRRVIPRLSRERVQLNFNTAPEKSAGAILSVHVKPGPADHTPLISLLRLSVIRVSVAALYVVVLIPNLILGTIFCAGHLFAELREYCRAALLGKRLPVIRISDRRRRETCSARALGSLPHLRRFPYMDSLLGLPIPALTCDVHP